MYDKHFVVKKIEMKLLKKTQNLKLWQKKIFKTQVETKIKNLNCDKTKIKNRISTKHTNSNFDKTQKLKL